MTFYIATLSDTPTIGNAYHHLGSPVLFWTREAARACINKFIIEKKRMLYKVEPVEVMSRLEKHVVTIHSPPSVMVEVTQEH